MSECTEPPAEVQYQSEPITGVNVPAPQRTLFRTGRMQGDECKKRAEWDALD